MAYSGDDLPSWFQGHQSDSAVIPSNTEDDHEHLPDDHEHQLSGDYGHQLLENHEQPMLSHSEKRTIKTNFRSISTPLNC